MHIDIQIPLHQCVCSEQYKGLKNKNYIDKSQISFRRLKQKKIRSQYLISKLKHVFMRLIKVCRQVLVNFQFLKIFTLLNNC